jgi:hypothetical protein
MRQHGTDTENRKNAGNADMKSRFHRDFLCTALATVRRILRRPLFQPQTRRGLESDKKDVSKRWIVALNDY